MTGTDTANMVPNKYDVLIDGHGYILWNGLIQNLPFRYQKAAYSYSKTFIERSNISGSYGDNSQDFFLTVSQGDWSEGQGQRFFRGNDTDRARRYYNGSAVDTTSVEGQVTMRPATITWDPTGTAVQASCGTGVAISSNVTHAYASTDSGTGTLHTVTAAGVDASIGAHGAGTVNQWGMCTDGINVYLAGATKIRKWTGAAFSDFSAQTNAGSIGFLDNVLYSCDGSALRSYDGTGAATTIFTWKDSTNTALPVLGRTPKIEPFGGDMLIFFPWLADRPELWLYDGTSTYRIAELPKSVVGHDIIVINGVVYLSALISTSSAGPYGLVPVVYVYLNGSINELWRSDTSVAGSFVNNSQFLPALGTVSGRLVFTDQASKRVLEYDMDSGAVSTIASLAVSGSYASTDSPKMSSAGTSIVFEYDAGNSSTGNTLALFPDPSNFASTATVDSSLIDFDNSLTKIFRGVKVEWEGAGSVNISYQIDTLSGSYTSLQTSAVSGTEYMFPTNTTGRSVSIRVTLVNSAGNKPTFKRLYVRAAPVQQSYRRCQYVLDLTGVTIGDGGANPVRLRDDTDQRLTGVAMAANLIAAIISTTPVTVTDRFGTYTAVAEQGEGVTELDEVRPGEYVAQTTWREV